MGVPSRSPPGRVDETAALTGEKYRGGGGAVAWGGAAGRDHQKKSEPGGSLLAGARGDESVVRSARWCNPGAHIRRSGDDGGALEVPYARRAATCCALGLVVIVAVAGWTSGSGGVDTAAASLGGAGVAAGAGDGKWKEGRTVGEDPLTAHHSRPESDSLSVVDGQTPAADEANTANAVDAAEAGNARLGFPTAMHGDGRGHWGAARSSAFKVRATVAQAALGGAHSGGDGSRACEILGKEGDCAKYAADSRQCSFTENWRVDSCLRLTELPQFFKVVDHELRTQSALFPAAKDAGDTGLSDVAGVKAAAGAVAGSESSTPEQPRLPLDGTGTPPLSPASLSAARVNHDWLPYPEWLSTYYGCVNGKADDHERPYRIPPGGRSKPAFDALRLAALAAVAIDHPSGTSAQVASPKPPPWPAANSAFIYAFVHVPKAAGSYFTEILRAQLWRLAHDVRSNGGGETNGEGGGEDPRHTYYPSEEYKPVMDLTEPNYRAVVENYMNGVPAPQAGQIGMAASFQAGHREIFKGSLAMGFCDVVNAPCAYLTVLRDPVERLLSQYAYLCLAGSEDRSGWTEEWKLAGACPLDPVAYFEKMGGVEVGVQLMAPRGDPGSRCALEAAKDNLVHGCTRFLLLEKLADGVKRIGAHLPDFAGFGDVLPGFRASHISNPTMLDTHNGSKQRLEPEQALRMEGYRADAGTMARLRQMAAHEIELYDHALANYEAQWDKPLASC